MAGWQPGVMYTVVDDLFTTPLPFPDGGIGYEFEVRDPNRTYSTPDPSKEPPPTEGEDGGDDPERSTSTPYEPGLDDWIPVWGPAKRAGYEFGEGHFWNGTAYTLLGIAEAWGIGALLGKAGKAGKALYRGHKARKGAKGKKAADAKRAADKGRKASELVSGKLKREFPSEHLNKTPNEIEKALKNATGKEKKSLQKAKKLLQQQERLRDKL